MVKELRTKNLRTTTSPNGDTLRVTGIYYEQLYQITK